VGERLHEDGFVNVTCIDTSPVVVQQMSERCAQREEMECTRCDACARVRVRACVCARMLTVRSQRDGRHGTRLSRRLLQRRVGQGCARAHAHAHAHTSGGPSGARSRRVVLAPATTDTILCGEDCFTKANAVLQEVWRVLMPGGVYVIISYAGPEKRVPLFEASGRAWSIQVARMRTSCAVRCGGALA
jgi:hypothetical protein